MCGIKHTGERGKAKTPEVRETAAGSSHLLFEKWMWVCDCVPLEPHTLAIRNYVYRVPKLSTENLMAPSRLCG
jgi:hypothetical protein